MYNKNTMGNNHLSSLAAKGRFGDTEIRSVDGQPSHVNKVEANLIDMYGSQGESLTKSLGTGDINPDTGMKEYPFPWLIAAAVGSAVVGAAGSYSGGRASQLQAESESKQADIGLEQIQKSIAALEKSTTAGRAAVMTDYGTAVETESYKTGVDKSDLFQGTARAIQASGMPTAGSVEQQSSLAWNRIRDRWSMKGDSLLADLGKRMGQLEGKYESEMAKLEGEKARFDQIKGSAGQRGKSWYLGKHLGAALR